MIKNLTVFVILLTGNIIFAQQQESCIYNQESHKLQIYLDGNSSEWTDVPKNIIEQNFQNETPTLNSAIWSAVWNDDGIYVLIEVSDNSWHPSWLTSTGWEHDRVELYFDVSYPQQDGLGAKDMQGNYQISPNYTEFNQGTAKEYISEQFPEGNSILSADTYNEEGFYTIEYFIPFSAIPTNSNEIVDPWVTTVIGFDATIIDADSDEVNGKMSNRAVWSNVGVNGESWNNCDGVGLLAFHCGGPPNKINNPKQKQKIIYYDANNYILNINTVAKSVLIFNPSGQLVKQLNENRTFINLNFLKSGVYIVKILDANNKLHNQKIIKL